MPNTTFFRSVVLLALGAVVGGLLTSTWKLPLHAQQQNPPAPPAPPAPTTQATVLADVTRLRDITPPSSHPMVDVGAHMVNLWFAVQKKNWPLANYYLGETRNRLRWETRLNPAPKGASGEPVDMKGTLDGIENGSFMMVKEVVDKKDANAFPAAYKHLLEDCYSCHKNAGRPYLRPMVPTTPQQIIINTDPNAAWPQ